MKNNIYYAAAFLLVLLPSTGTAQVADKADTNISATVSDVSATEVKEQSASATVVTDVPDVNAAEAVAEENTQTIQNAETEAATAGAEVSETVTTDVLETNMSVEHVTTAAVHDENQSVANEGVVEEVTQSPAEEKDISVEAVTTAAIPDENQSVANEGVNEEVSQSPVQTAAEETNISVEAVTTTVVSDKGQNVADEGVVEEVSKPMTETAGEVNGTSEKTEETELPAAASEERVPEAAEKSGSVLELFESIELKEKEETAPATVQGAPKPEKTVTKKSTGGVRYIVVGTYSTKTNADSQLESLAAAFEKLPDIIQKQREHGFGYSSKSSGRYFIASIGPFTSSDVLNSVLVETRKLYPDAYVLRQSGKGAATAKKAPKAEELPTRKTEKLKEKRAVTKQKPVEEIGVAAVIGESVTALEDVEIEDESAEVMPEPKSGLSEKTMLLGVAALLALLFVLLFFAARRKPKAKIKTEMKEEGAEVSAEARAEEKKPEIKAKRVEAVPTEAVTVEKRAEKPAVPPAEAEVKRAEKAAPAFEKKEKPAAKKEAAPAAKGRRKREPRSDRGKVAKEDFAEFSGARILVAEDNLINQKVILGLLGESGMEVTIANDGQEALDILETDSDYQLVLMDAHMPRVDGFEATRKIRANPKFDHIAVAALSGDTSTDDIRKMQEAGMEEQLEKPLKMDALYDVLYSYVTVPSEEAKQQPQKGTGLNRAAGLEITGGDEELYNEVLAEFVSMYGRSDAELTKLFSVGDLAQAKALLLDIKSLAANIGAETLSDTAEELREAIINGEEGRFGTLLDMFKAELHAVLDAV
jgi:CheY-like chemotaxis protein